MDAVAARWNVRDFGRCAYRPVWRAMQAYTDGRDDGSADELWLVEHPPVYTLGQAGRRDHLLAPGEIEVIAVDRGGQVTYHGPGQIVAYPLIDLRRLRLGVRELVCRIEQAIIDTLGEYGLSAERRSGAPGVYLGAAKIAALGLRVRRGCSFHGLAFNIAMDLSPFRAINPCGYPGLEVVQLRDFCPEVAVATVKPRLIDQLSRQLGLTPCAAAAEWPEFTSNLRASPDD